MLANFFWHRCGRGAPTLAIFELYACARFTWPQTFLGHTDGFYSCFFSISRFPFAQVNRILRNFVNWEQILSTFPFIPPWCVLRDLLSVYSVFTNQAFLLARSILLFLTRGRISTPPRAMAPEPRARFGPNIHVCVQRQRCFTQSFVLAFFWWHVDKLTRCELKFHPPVSLHPIFKMKEK